MQTNHTAPEKAESEAIRHKRQIACLCAQLEHLKSKIPSEPSGLTREDLYTISKDLLRITSDLSAEYRTL
jgi:hypothetical protein